MAAPVHPQTVAQAIEQKSEYQLWVLSCDPVLPGPHMRFHGSCANIAGEG